MTQYQISQGVVWFQKAGLPGLRVELNLSIRPLSIVTYVCGCGSWMRVSTSGSGSRHVLIDSGMQGFSILAGLEVR